MSEIELTPEDVALLEAAEQAPALEMRSATESVDVDFGQRIITVLAVPYNTPTLVPFQRDIYEESFAPTAFAGIETRNRPVPATACLEIPAEDHKGGRIVGRSVEFRSNDPRGLVADLKIGRTPYGDETLELANERALSVSVGFRVKNRLDQVINRAAKTRVVTRAFLDHIAFVGSPAYEDAGVLAMRGVDSVDNTPMSTTPGLDNWLEQQRSLDQWNAQRAQRRS